LSERSPQTTPDALVALRGVAKTFGAVRALRGVDLDIQAGEVHALVGENGAGKSTIVKLIAGLFGPDSGSIELDGQPVELTTPLDALSHGIAVIHQHPALLPDLDVAENVFAGRLPRRRRWSIDRGAMYAAVAEQLGNLGVALDPHRPADGLSMAEQQLVEIVKALTQNARVIVMDEPTASLSAREIEQLLRIVRDLRERGVGILYVSHALEDVFSIADRVTILRDGRRVASEPTSELTIDATVRHMVGRPLEAFFAKETASIGEVVLDVQGLSRAPAFSDVSFDLHSGEILGFAGLVGAGRSEVARVLFGIDRSDRGVIRVGGSPLQIDSPATAVANGIVYVPEDRHRQGLILELSIAMNVALPNLQRTSRLGFASARRERELARGLFSRLRIKAPSVDTVVGALSGGNQQKVVIAKWLATRPSILILDEPTHGVDVGAKAEVHRLISQLAGEGMAVILISSELPEVLALSDRIIVLREGQVAAHFTREEADQERVMFAATGQEAHALAG
jgi:rhamnose transport system ATP-binding protein